MNKRIITIIIALAAVCGCQKTEKTIYKVPLSEHAMELKRQERAYNDSLEKYSALLDTAKIQYYFDLHKTVLDTLSVVMQQEAEAFMAAKDKEAANEGKQQHDHRTHPPRSSHHPAHRHNYLRQHHHPLLDPHRLVLRGCMALAEASPHHPQTVHPELFNAR